MEKKKILLLSDDLRMHSGVATMSRELVLGTVHKYHWVQMAGAIKNPDSGKVMDLTQATKDMIKQGKVKSDEDVYVKLYPVDGYGNENILNAVMMQENPDAIMHFTDPRFWGWLYAIEHSIRQKVPLIFLDIWDDLPYPMYNRAFYESCDALFAISKQTDNINLWVRDPKECCRINGWYDEKGNLHPYTNENITSELIADSRGNEIGVRVVSLGETTPSTKKDMIERIKDSLPPSISSELNPVVEDFVNKNINK